MFGALLETSFIADIEKKAVPFVNIDRDKYKKVRETVNQFCRDNPVYVSDPETLAGGPCCIESFNIYSDNPYRYAVKLTNALYKNCTKYVVMKTMSKHEHMEIFLNARKIAVFISVERKKNIKTSDLILPVEIDGINYMSPELELVALYRNLYNPNKSGEWETSLKLEEILLKQVYERIGILGGKCTTCKVKRTTNINTLRELIVTQFIPSRAYVLLGEWAVQIYQGNKPKSVEKIQIISERPIEDDLRDLIEFLGQYTDFAVTYRKKTIMVPKDFRTHKFMIYVEYPKLGKTVRKPIMDIYNSAQFELIPYIPKSGYMLGNPFVLARFIMIDLWIIRIIHKMNLIQKEFLKTKVRDIFNLLKQVKKIKGATFGTQYFGKFQDYVISKKIEMLKKEFSHPYYPAIEDKSKGLREV